MLYHPVAEHLPQDIAPELRQRGVNEQVLLLQCFCQRAARTGILLLHSRVFHETGDDLQRADRFIQRGSRLPDFFQHGPHYNLSGRLRVAEVHPVEWRGIVRVGGRRHLSQHVPQVEPGLDVVRAGDGDVRDFIPFHLLQHRRIGSGLRFPVVAEEIIDTGNEAFRLVQAYVGITEELASDVGPGHDVRVIERDGQAGVSERPQCHVEPGQTCQHLRTGSATFARRIGMAGSFAFCTFGLGKRKFQVKTVVKGECRIERTSFLTLETLDKPGGAG